MIKHFYPERVHRSDRDQEQEEQDEEDFQLEETQKMMQENILKT